MLLKTNPFAVSKSGMINGLAELLHLLFYCAGAETASGRKTIKNIKLYFIYYCHLITILLLEIQNL